MPALSSHALAVRTLVAHDLTCTARRKDTDAAPSSRGCTLPPTAAVPVRRVGRTGLQGHGPTPPVEEAYCRRPWADCSALEVARRRPTLCSCPWRARSRLTGGVSDMFAAYRSAAPRASSTGCAESRRRCLEDHTVAGDRVYGGVGTEGIRTMPTASGVMRGWAKHSSTPVREAQWSAAYNAAAAVAEPAVGLDGLRAVRPRWTISTWNFHCPLE
jgi:hypothetical protein